MSGSIPKSILGDMRFAKRTDKWNDNYREYTLTPEEQAVVIEKYGPPSAPLYKNKKDYADFKPQKEEKKCSQCGKDHYANGLCQSCNLKRIYNERKENGMCVKCGKEKADKGTRCITCIKRGLR